eukprot:TRINITY_DN23255_c0_g1_i1.p1 TRINITY_DN23255_c0_g1~~TRINITY_DN23255_c0_g1_i1.p1  ORF type:complete len:295 (-),score=63.71 TRINITY_DN23255_c0_g1_i1:290-1090(-)
MAAAGGDAAPCFHSCRALIGPSVLDCDTARLAEESGRALDAGADYIHLDMMDGHFVPNLSFGPSLAANLRKNHPTVFLSCHLMVSNPAQYVEQIAAAKAVDDKGDCLTAFTFHVETTEPDGTTQQVIDSVKKTGLKVGLTLCPDTPIDVVLKYADQVDMVLVMTVVPGKGGQSFMTSMMDKVRTVRAKYPTMDIEVDGGVKVHTVDEAAKAGANMIVSGTGVFKVDDMSFAISTMKRSVEKYGNGLPEDQLSPERRDSDAKKPRTT